MAAKLFSPSLTRREEPPNSMATVMHVGTTSCLVNFRGKSYTAKMVGTGWGQGDTGYFIEAPRGKYWITREQGSWYANKLENWLKKGLKANVALEYFLRKCEKWRPFMVSDTGELLKNPAPKIPSTDPTVSNFGTSNAFENLDADDDGLISAAEWAAAGGSTKAFEALDKDGDGFISPEEWNRGNTAGGKLRIYAPMLGTDPAGPPDPPDPEDPIWEPYEEPIVLPPGFVDPGPDSWYAFTDCAVSVYPTYITQADNSTTYTTATGAFDIFNLPAEAYFYGKTNLAAPLNGPVIQSGRNRTFIKGAAGAPGNKMKFDGIYCSFGGGLVSNGSAAPLIAVANAAAAAVNAGTGKLILVQNGAPPQQIRLIATTESQAFMLGSDSIFQITGYVKKIMP